MTVTATVENIGDRAGSKVIQLYVKTPSLTGSNIPKKRLKDYVKVNLEAGESEKITFTVDCAELALWNEQEDKYAVEAAEYIFDVATSADDADICGSAKVKVAGERDAILQAVTLDTDDTCVQIADKEYPLKKWDVVCVFPLMPHGYTISCNDYERTRKSFCIVANPSMLGNMSILLQRYACDTPVVPSHLVHPEVYTAIEKIYEHSSGGES